MKFALDKDLDLRAEIEMVAREVLRKIGNQYIYGDETIGENITDTIVYFKNKKNSGASTMRAQLKTVHDNTRDAHSSELGGAKIASFQADSLLRRIDYGSTPLCADLSLNATTNTATSTDGGSNSLRRVGRPPSPC